MKTAEEILQGKNGDMIHVAPDTRIHDALQIMVEKKIGAILVKDAGEIVGIWTERDLMSNVMMEGFDPKTAKLRDYMTTNLWHSPHDAHAYALLDQILGRRHRHLLIEKNGRTIGLLSAGDVIKACLQQKDRELKNLNKMVSWEYYEDWKWQ